jgi:hypothetical protein
LFESTLYQFVHEEMSRPLPPQSQKSRVVRRIFKPELIISIDTELDGSNPLTNNLLSIGLVAINVRLDEKKPEEEAMTAQFYCTILPDPNKPADPRTVQAFWSKHPEAWQEVHSNAIPVNIAMAQVSSFLRNLARTHHIKFVAKPACVDWMFFKSVYETYGPEDRYPIGHHCHCLATMNLVYKLMTGEDMTLMRTVGGQAYKHHALTDAYCQALEYLKLRRKIDRIKLRTQKSPTVQ